MPDRGVSIVSADVARDANLSITPTSTELRNASNCVMRLVGEARVVLCKDKCSAVTTALVVSECYVRYSSPAMLSLFHTIKVSRIT